MTEADTDAKRSFLKTVLRHTVVITQSSFSFILPKHKADRLYEGNTILIEARPSNFAQSNLSYLFASTRLKVPLSPSTVALVLRTASNVLMGRTPHEGCAW